MKTLMSRLLDLVFRRRRDDRLSEEVQAHLDLLTDEHIARGLSPAEARLAARRSFGGVDQVKMRYREQRGLPMVDAWLQDLRFALRLLARDRGFAATVIVVLAVGIGVNNMFFTLVYSHKLRGMPIADAGRVMYLSTFDDNVPDRAISPPEFADLGQAQTSFTDLAAFANGVVTVGDEGRAPDRFDAAYVSANAFPLIGVSPLIGRLPSLDEDRPGAAPVVMLGAGAWRSRYDGDAGVLGRSILINGSPATVVGIIPDRSGFPSNAGVWLPLGQFAGLSPARDSRTLRVFGRLRDTATASLARAEIEGIFSGFEAAYPETNRRLRARVVPINDRMFGDLTGWGQFIIAGVIVVLVACANVANLMIARALHRAPEIAIRTSLGASRVRILRQLLVEASVLAAIGGAIGGGLSVGGARLFQSTIPAGTMPYWFHYAMDGRVFAALVAISLATVVVSGLVPALQASRTDVNRTLKDGGRWAMGHGGTRLWTGAFLTAELALAMVLLTQVALAALTARVSVPSDAKINTTAVLTTAVTLPATAYPTAGRRMEFFRHLDDRLTGRADVVAVSRASMLPGDGGGERRLDIEGRPPADASAAPEVLVVDIAPSYFTTIDVPLLRGREFTAADGAGGEGSAIVNQPFADVFLKGTEPLGSRIAVTAPNAPVGAAVDWVTIVGVAQPVRQQPGGGGDRIEPVVYLPIAATAPVTSVVMVRHTIDPAAAATLLRAEVQAIDPNVPLYRMRTLAGAVRDAQWNRRVSIVLANTVCLLSVLLAIVGLSAVTTQRVTLKRREIGLRLALGARSSQVVQLILGSLRTPLILGLLLGTAGALAWDGAFAAGAPGIYASAPKTLLKITGLITAVVFIACLAPLRRATRMNPVTALRQD